VHIDNLGVIYKYYSIHFSHSKDRMTITASTCESLRKCCNNRSRASRSFDTKVTLYPWALLLVQRRILCTSELIPLRTLCAFLGKGQRRTEG